MRNQIRLEDWKFESWLEAVKDRAAELKLDFIDLDNAYSFQEAYYYDMKPNETVNDAALELLLQR